MSIPNILPAARRVAVPAPSLPQRPGMTLLSSAMLPRVPLSRALLAVALLPATLLPVTPVLAQSASGVSVWTFKNSTGLPDDAVFVQIPDGTLTNVCGGTAAAPQCYTSGGGQVFSLAQLYGSVPGAGTGGPTGTSVPVLFIDTASSARLQVNLGIAAPTTANVVQGLVEMTASGDSASNNLDVSYVNSVSLPISLSVRSRSDGSLYPTTQTGLWPNNQVNTSSGATIFSNLAAVVPASAVTSGSYSAVDDSGATVGTVSGTFAVSSPSTNATGYHDWSEVIASGDSITIGSYSVPAGQPLASVLYGFSAVTAGSTGELPSSPFNTNTVTLSGPSPSTVTDPSNVFLAGQSYTLTATFMADLNPGGANTRISSLGAYGIPAGTPGVKISGYGGASGNATSTTTGNFDIYITSAQLNAASGIYGANPAYVVDWTGNATPAAVATVNTNSLADRVVGDLMAGITFGMVGSSAQIGATMTANGTTANFANTQWSSKTTTTISGLSTGEYFYLLALQQTPAQFAGWVGSGIQTDSDAYDVYGNAFQSLTQAYAFAYSDRINASTALDPDLFYSGGSSPPPIDDIYIELELLPGGYTYTPTTSSGR